MQRIRPPAVAGTFYPADPYQLNEFLDDCLDLNPLGPRGSPARSSSFVGGMVPHAGYAYSGPCAAHLYAFLRNSSLRVIILGVNHWARGHRASLSPWSYWATPLGNAAVDQALSEALRKRVAFLEADERAHSGEHSIEVQLPFLQRLAKSFTFLPISLSSLPLKDCEALGCAIGEACRNESRGPQQIIILASSDLNHYLTPEQNNERDLLALEKVLAMDPEGLLRTVERRNITMCGVIPTTVMLFAAANLGAKQARLLQHYHSGEVTSMKTVVGYASVALES